MAPVATDLLQFLTISLKSPSVHYRKTPRLCNSPSPQIPNGMFSLRSNRLSSSRIVWRLDLVLSSPPCLRWLASSQDPTPGPRHTNPYNLRRSKPRTEIQCPNIRFELEKGLGVLEFNDPVR